ncbi:MAG: hypothetical protein E7Z89_04495 [Cyanobacteria bacterium SIG28]|nr:hypothetical protein [Cyanobacteria bacterium SIG28]
MKKNFLIALILTLLILFLSYFIYEHYRYSVSSPLEDYEYKRAIIAESKDLSYRLENMRSLVGPNELEKFIKENDNNPQIYTPSEENLKNGVFQANLHMHTTNSDGSVSVEFLMNQAQIYAEKFLNGKPFYLAITDHNTVLGAKDVIKVLQENPDKYKNVKVITGMEIFTEYKTSYSEKPIEIHVLTWCINPYDKFLNKEFFKKDLKDKFNRIYPDRDFNDVIEYMSNLSIVGIAHPARYLERIEDKELYIKELFENYKSKNKNKIFFTEGYYQSYHLLFNTQDNKTKDFLNYINKEAQRSNVIRTGSTDVHGYSIFKK